MLIPKQESKLISFDSKKLPGSCGSEIIPNSKFKKSEQDVTFVGDNSKYIYVPRNRHVIRQNYGNEFNEMSNNHETTSSFA